MILRGSSIAFSDALLYILVFTCLRIVGSFGSRGGLFWWQLLVCFKIFSIWLASITLCISLVGSGHAGGGSDEPCCQSR